MRSRKPNSGLVAAARSRTLSECRPQREWRKRCSGFPYRPQRETWIRNPGRRLAVV